MCLKVYLVLSVYFSNKILNLAALDETKYLVSTTQNPSDSTTKNLKSRIEILELQNANIQKTIGELLKSNENKFECVENKQQLSERQFSQIQNTIIAEIAKVETQVKYLLKDFSRKQELEEQQFAEIQNTIVAKIEKVETEVGNMLRESKESQKSDSNATQSLLKKTEEKIISKVERTQRLWLPQDCQDVQASEIYLILPKNAPEPFAVLCDMDVRGGGWIYVLNRFEGSQDFSLNWTAYKKGFGALRGEFWLGLERLYQLTAFSDTELLILLTNFNGIEKFAHYKKFRIGSEAENYKLEDLDGYSGDVGNDLIYHLGRNFSTLDHPDPQWGGCHRYTGSWWYGVEKGCFRVQLTGRYGHGKTMGSTGIHWATFSGYKYSLQKVRMLVRSSRDQH